MRNKTANLLKTVRNMHNGVTLMCLSIFLSVIFAIFSMIVPLFIGKAVDSMAEESEAVLQLKVDFSILGKFIGLSVIAVVLACIVQYILNRTNIVISNTIIRKLRDDAYAKVSRLPMSYIDKHTSGKLQSLIISDIDTAGTGIQMFLNQFFVSVMSIVITLVIMFRLQWKITLFVLLFTPISFLTSFFIAKRTYNSFKKQADIRSKQTQFINEVANNFIIQKKYSIEDNTFDDFEKINNAYRNTSVKSTFFSSITNPSTRFINALIYAGVALIGARIATETGSAFTVGALTSILAYCSQFMKPFNELSGVLTELTDAFACMDRIYSFLALDESVELEESEQILLENIINELEFRNVTFGYDKKPVLKNVSFKVSNGQKLAIVGPTGCGKTTIINLLMRYYEPQEGEILINGINIKKIPVDVLRSKISMVSQDTWFKNGSISENLKYGNVDLSDEKMNDFAKLSGAKSFIRQLPDKFDYVINNNSSDFSEGQRQLLSITRTMCSDPEFIILDEATASVDIYSEKKIQKSFDELLKGRTSIVIAHRLSTIVDADVIVVLVDGEVKQSGSHAELYKENGYYSKLYNTYINE
ncbi:MAG: ABC transporter ATP-binding protein/permease [Clostridia bacterium]|nr:ABC transporter ATP-binding protein/permease [Clostridia bacterium]